MSHGGTGCESRAGVAVREPVPFVFKMAGEFYLAGALVLGAGYLWAPSSFYGNSASGGGIDPGACPAIVSGVHHLSAAAAGGDGFGQDEVKND